MRSVDCIVLQRIAACCRVGCSALQIRGRGKWDLIDAISRLQWVAVGCSGLQWVALGCTGLHWVALGCTGLQWVAVGCSGLQSELQSVAH